MRRGALLAAALMLCACTGGGGGEAVILPDPTFPDDVVVGREEIAQGPERSGNVRWYVSGDGCFYNARNSFLRVTGDQVSGSDPALHYNKPFPDQPQRCFSNGQLERLRAAVDALDAAALAADSPLGSLEGLAEAVVRRWTLTDSSGTTHRIVAVRDEEPPELADLGALVDQLVTESAS